MTHPRTWMHEHGTRRDNQRDDATVTAVMTGLALPKLTPEIRLIALEATVSAVTVWRDGVAK